VAPDAVEREVRGISVVLVCSDVVLRGELRDGAMIRRRLSDILNSGIDDVEVFDAEALTAHSLIGELRSSPPGVEGMPPAVAVRRSAILVALPIADRASRAPAWDTHVEKLPEPAAMVVGDLVVRGNVWRMAGADLGMTMRAQTGNFLPVTEAEVSRVPGSREPFSATGVAIVNRAAIRMWTAIPARPAPQERRAPERLPVAELVGTRARQPVGATSR
jgi:hypothetical protein